MPPAVTQKEVTALVADLKLQPNMPILDIACGAGRHAVELARQGYSVTGVDISLESLTLARERSHGTGAVFIEADLDAWTPERRYQAAYWLGNGLTYLPPSRFRSWLTRLHAALEPGARFIAETGCCADSLMTKLKHRTWYEAAGIFMAIDNTYHAREGFLHTRMRYFENGFESQAESIHHVYTAAELIRLFEAAGFHLIQLDSGPGTDAYSPDSHAARFVLEA
jgi:SAM-dependent methyltransferase